MSIPIKINGRLLMAEDGSSVLEAARSAGIHIPSLCHVKGLHEGGACRVCLVEDEKGRLISSCDSPVYEGMEIITDSRKVLEARRRNLELLCENHRMDCDNCFRYTDCEFHSVCSEAGINSDDHELFTLSPAPDGSDCIIRDNSKCLLCRRCVAACSARGLSLISPLLRGAAAEIGTALPLSESGCVGCGSCVAVCPTAALTPRGHSQFVWPLLLKKQRHLAAIITPAAAKLFGEAYHEAPGSTEAGKLPALLRKLGFDTVYSADAFEADYDAALAAEAAERGYTISAACPAVRKYVETHARQLLPGLSRARTPLSMLIGAVKQKSPDCDIVFIGSCTALKAYAGELGLAAVLTVPEAAAMFDRACVSRASALKVWRSCGSECCDSIAPTAVRDTVSALSVKGLREFIEITSAEREMCGIIKAYGCPGGCINGGGQPRLPSAELSGGAVDRRN